jgi:hypothetical protein
MNLGALWCPGVGSVHVFYHLTYVPDIVWFYFVLYSLVVLTHCHFMITNLILARPLTVNDRDERSPTSALYIFHGP